MSKFDRSEHRFGYARWAEDADVMASGLTSGATSLHFGYWGHHPMSLDDDGPAILLGGAGTGKMTTSVGVTAISCTETCIFNDPRGEIAATSMVAQVMMGKRAYCVNPLRMHSHIVPSHSVDVLSFLKPDSRSLTSDIKLLCQDHIPDSPSGEDKFFTGRARAWEEAFFKGDVLKYGSASLPRIANYVAALSGKKDDWIDLAANLAATSPDVAKTIRQINSMKASGNKAFDGIVGELTNGLSFMTDPAIAETLSENADFSIDDLFDGDRPTNCYLVVPAELMKVWAPFLRLLVSAMMIVKSRNPQAPRANFIIDEAAQLGKADFLERAYTFGRGAGIRTQAVFQDMGQIRRNFGEGAISTFMGSSQIRQFIGVRDYETAHLISNTLGIETLEYADPLQQERSKLARQQAVQAILRGADPFQVAREVRHHSDASEHLMKQPRQLMTPAEILALPSDQQVLFVSGKGCPPILSGRYPYFLNPAMAGRYLPNPGHPPGDKLKVAIGSRQVWRRVMQERVPQAYAHLPQYQSGYWHYVEGFRPQIRPLPY